MQESESARQQPSSALGAAEIAKLETQRNGGAGWFSAIAMFSIINLLILAFGGGVNFVIGRGITQLIDVLCMILSKQLEANTGILFRVVGGIVTVCIAGLFLLLGMLCRRGHLWAFLVGMVLYALDGLIFLFFQDWLSLGFHVFALLMLAGGMKAQLQLNRLPPPVAEAPTVEAAES